ncbi:DUF397 domain-containing protein [Actinomadura rupiterrae]|uniref:DUF397 domain-containing protein n=1 Tax=Actinomadura rupiterrae TaxID=559627 RepID=UPI0020A254E3|nr:DUF397 domain-containing protein [Actinomadura rupiterrae]MCP2335651.1 hypothetical protein [Actinomadura rupiterrae]
MKQAEPTWRKSTYSQGGGSDCVEIAESGPGCLVRDSKDTSGPVLKVDAVTWHAFIGRLKQGDFDT